MKAPRRPQATVHEVTGAAAEAWLSRIPAGQPGAGFIPRPPRRMHGIQAWHWRQNAKLLALFLAVGVLLALRVAGRL